MSGPVTYMWKYRNYDLKFVSFNARHNSLTSVSEMFWSMLLCSGFGMDVLHAQNIDTLTGVFLLVFLSPTVFHC